MYISLSTFVLLMTSKTSDCGSGILPLVSAHLPDFLIPVLPQITTMVPKNSTWGLFIVLYTLHSKNYKILSSPNQVSCLFNLRNYGFDYISSDQSLFSTLFHTCFLFIVSSLLFSQNFISKNLNSLHSYYVGFFLLLLLKTLKILHSSLFLSFATIFIL